jgi:phage gpG-like protein
MFPVGTLELSFEIAGEVKIRRAFEGVLANLDDMSPALERIAGHFQAHMEQVFQSEGGATKSGAWKPLSRRYAREKAKQFPGKGILEARGDLRRALTGKGPGSIREIGRQELKVGASVRTANGKWDIGLIHQKGTRDGRVPMRPLIDPPPAFATQVVREVREHLNVEP